MISTTTDAPFHDAVRFRTQLAPSDPSRVVAVTVSTGFFSAEEVAIAQELATLARSEGQTSGYSFLLAETDAHADQPGQLLGYACYGQIPATEASYDLYWIVVSPDQQRRGIGAKLLAETERLLRELGATKLYADTAGRPQYHSTHAFYESHGYLREATLRDFYAPGDDKLIFSKTLT